MLDHPVPATPVVRADERLAQAIAEVLRAIQLLDARLTKIEAALIRRGSA